MVFAKAKAYETPNNKRKTTINAAMRPFRWLSESEITIFMKDYFIGYYQKKTLTPDSGLKESLLYLEK